jgi:hypothetical protein
MPDNLPRVGDTLQSFVKRWSVSGAAEKSNAQTFLSELCDALGVERPHPAKGDPDIDNYVFERDAVIQHEGGSTTVGKIDLYKHGCFVLEAKQGAGEESKKLGTAKRNTPAWQIAMRDAYGQALGYARGLDKPPPFLIVCDVGYCFDLYATFDGSWDFRPFPSAQAFRVFLRDIEHHCDTLQRIFTNPLSLDPSKNATEVTRDVAKHLADLAQRLDKKHSPEDVATFLMRCIFTMFAEDVGLIQLGLFETALETTWLDEPELFAGECESLWRAMNDGGHVFRVGKLLKFNGSLFKKPRALPLDRKGIAILLKAAKCDWSKVEPAIFGTLLERALDPRERHRLGAHFTPRAYVERLVRPTIEEPLRRDWDLVQMQVRKLVAKEKIKAAQNLVRDFHQKLCKTRVLDPACGSGNFLYVALDLFKRLEGEVLELLSHLGEKRTLLHLEGVRVNPSQFLGIEVKRWAKEIAELVLWIGYLQWHFRAYGINLPVPEPVLRDYKNIECRDAVLAWDDLEKLKDEKGKPVTRWDGVTTKTHPVTGEDVPDESAREPVMRYVKPRQAEWPEADFVVGNPPYIGNKRMRLALGDGYVEALRAAWPDVPETSDLVMYWWEKAATLIRAGKLRRFGLITTNSITQTFSRKVVQRHLESGKMSLCLAIPDHPWVDSANGAAVRVAMTVGGAGRRRGRLIAVLYESSGFDGEVAVGLSTTRGLINPDLTCGVAHSGAQALKSNRELGFRGVTLVGHGFILEPGCQLARSKVVRRLVGARTLLSGTDPRLVIDFYGVDEESARSRFSEEFQHLYDTVRPIRQEQKRKAYAANWWIFAEPRGNYRTAARGLPRFIATVETSRHRWFTFVNGRDLPEQTLVALALDDAYFLGVLSSWAHCLWATRVGSRLGVGNDERYTIARCFDPFPFPTCAEKQKQKVGALAEALDAHRKNQQAAHPDLTITGMYNVLKKLRSGEALTTKERVIHEQGLVSVLKQIHDDLDEAVLDGYGWPHDISDEEIIERLVALNAERAEEEKRGKIRWLRPEFQEPRAKKTVQQELPAAEEEAAPRGKKRGKANCSVWGYRRTESISKQSHWDQIRQTSIKSLWSTKPL